jgi:hypothetical protein
VRAADRGPPRGRPPCAAGGRQQRAHLRSDQPTDAQPPLRAGPRRTVRRRSDGSAGAPRRVRGRKATTESAVSLADRLPPRRARRRQAVLPARRSMRGPTFSRTTRARSEGFEPMRIACELYNRGLTRG